jgi:elongation of very long chain fatty acids protein 6
MASLIEQLIEYNNQLTFDTRTDYWLNTFTHSLPWVTVALYLLMVHGLPVLLKNVNTSLYATPLKVIMAAWNLFLSVLSLIMVSGILLPYIQVVIENGFVHTALCDTDDILFEPAPKLFWVNVFMWSKYLELFDTLFLIVKKPSRPVPFLHWYHHASVLLVCWYALYSHYPTGYIFVIINASIHTVMYFYYFLTELGIHPNWNKLLTMCQIAQMVIGVVINAWWIFVFFVSNKSCKCDRPVGMAIGVSIMYTTYLFLFVQFFINRYKNNKTTKNE